MYQLIVLPKSKQDIKNAALWYEEQRKGLGKKFTAEVRAAEKYIQQNPLKVEIRYDNIRMFKINIFPYCLHFDVNQDERIIKLVAVFATKQNSEDWKER
jgi:mRNA-degrading endonuclease RelE of RelBE toxin-antitoxin system